MALFGKFSSRTELINAVIARDEAAQQELFDEFWPRIHRYVRHLLGLNHWVQPQDSDDVTEKVLCKALDPKRLKRIRDKELFRQWIYRIAEREAIGHLKKRSKLKAVALDDQNTSPESVERVHSIEKMLETADRIEKILKIAKQTDKRLYEILESQLDDKKDKQIAEDLGIKEPNVRTIRRRGLKRIRAILENQDSDE